MCGRTTFLASWADILEFSRPLVVAAPDRPEPSPTWNFAPTQVGPVLVAEEDGDADARVEAMRWGLVPGWARDLKIGAQTINARVETVTSKPAFRAAWKRRRCLVPVSGYYEWPQRGEVKQPYFIHPADSPLMFLAGLWEEWHSPEGSLLRTYTIITRASQGEVAPLHHRMPLALEPDVFVEWLLGEATRAQSIVDGAPPVAVCFHPVARKVGNPRNNSPELVEPIALEAELDEPASA